MRHLIQRLTMNTRTNLGDIHLRKAFLGLTRRDEALLRRHRHRLLRHTGDFVRRFYRHLRRFIPLRHLLSSPQQVRRLQDTQARYFRSLLGDRCDADYVRDRLRIGTAHQRIGLELKWYMGSYALYLMELLPQLWRDPELDPDTQEDLTRALIRRIFFDMGLAIDTYVDADLRQIEALKTYAERVIETAPCGLVVAGANLEILSANPKFAEMFDRADLPGQSLENVLPVPNLRQLASAILRNRIPYDFNLKHQHGDQRCLYHIEIAPIELGDLVSGEGYGLILSVEDYTERDALRLLSTQRGARLDALMTSVPDGIVVFTAEGTLESWNPAVEELFGYRDDELAGINISKLLLKQRYQPIFAHQLMQHLWRHERQRLEAFGLKKDGGLLHLEVAVNRILPSDPPLYLAVLQDVSARKQAEADLSRLARFDPLTRLPNRSLYLERLRIEMTRARRYQKLLAVMFLDLDDFKKVNDSLGHLAGDKLLQEIARRLADTVRETDTVARFGGDEFTFLVTDLTETGAWQPIAAKILDAFQQPVRLEGREIFVKASIGISLFPLHGDDPHTLLRHADTAMYQAKFHGHNQVCCYDTSMEAETSQRVILESELHRALERDELYLVYQPKVATDSHRVTGFEVLLRWHNRKLGQVPPNRFIPALETLGLIQSVGCWTLQTALKQVEQWRRRYGQPLQIAVNVSSRQIGGEDFAAMVFQLLEEMDFPAADLELEITETTLMESDETTLSNIDILRKAGVRFAIDDFGTGYSSLSYLRNFPFDTLKIDRSFIQNLDNEADQALANHIVAIGHSLGLEVIAEGVEDQKQLQIVTELGCDQVQGYLFYRPLPPEEIGKALDDILQSC